MTNKFILCCNKIIDRALYESINHFIMMNMECCKEWIELYESKRSGILAQHHLFHSENSRGIPIPPHLRDDNWPKECTRTWIKEAIEVKLVEGAKEKTYEDALNIAHGCNYEVIIIMYSYGLKFNFF